MQNIDSRIMTQDFRGCKIMTQDFRGCKILTQDFGCSYRIPRALSIWDLKCGLIGCVYLLTVFQRLLVVA